MIAKLKLAAYVILCALALWFGRQFYFSYSNIGAQSPGAGTNPSPVAGELPKTEPTNAVPPVVDATGATNVSTNSDATNVVAGTNAAGSSNVVQQPVAPVPTNLTASNPPLPAPTTAGSGVIVSLPGQGARTVKYLAAFVGALVGLGILIAYDVSQFMGSRAVDYLFNDDGEGERDPEYEQAEQTWVNGKPIEAIEMMREYLKKNPREQYVALRIAEIYEKDLKNYLAAALEYEEVLKKKLNPDRWGRAAIHLCNIYSRMGKQEQRKELLEKIARDYSQTGAAKKARQYLGIPEPEDVLEPVEPAAEPEAEPDSGQAQVFDLDEVIARPDEVAPAPPPEPTAAPEPPKSNLPPGFRKKK